MKNIKRILVVIIIIEGIYMSILRALQIVSASGLTLSQEIRLGNAECVFWICLVGWAMLYKRSY